MTDIGATVDNLVREAVREAVAETARAFKHEFRQLVAEELAKVSVQTTRTDAAYVTVKAAARIAGVHDATIRNWIKGGKLKAYHPELRVLRVRVDELHSLMAGGNDVGDGEVIDFDDRVRALTARAAKFNSKK